MFFVTNDTFLTHYSISNIRARGSSTVAMTWLNIPAHNYNCFLVPPSITKKPVSTGASAIYVTDFEKSTTSESGN